MIPWFGDLQPFRRDPLGFFYERGTQAKEPFVKLAMGFAPVYLVADAAYVKPIMKASEDQIDKGRLIYKLREIIGQSSMVLSGERHRERRAVIHQQLARGLASTYVRQMSAIIRRQAALLAREQVFDAHAAAAPLALRMISMILFGPNALSPGDENALVEAVHLVEDDLAADMFRIVPDLPWVKRRKKRKLAEGRKIMSLVVNRARAKAAESSLLRSLAPLNLTDEELNDEVLLLFLAGHHTSGTAAAWLLYHLAINESLCNAIAHEARSVCDDTGEIRPELLKNASLSLAAGCETLRLFPSAYWLSREAKQTVELGGYKFKRGTSFLMSAWHLHRDPRYWDRPEDFDVSRSHMKNAAYIPFGAGPRACVGMGVGLLELQLLALEMAASLEFKDVSPFPAPRPKPSVTLIPPQIRIEVGLRQAVKTAAVA
jgi:cytochrome P450